MDLTETRLGGEQLADGVLLKVYRDRVRIPDGGTSVREWIDHPGASAVVPVFEDGTTILIRQFRYPPRREFLEVPAGKLDYHGEDPHAVALRELEEETGWTAGRLTRLTTSFPCIGYSNEKIHFFLAEDLQPGRREADEGEFVVPVRLPFEEAYRRAVEGEIGDMKSAMALVFAHNAMQTRRG